MNKQKIVTDVRLAALLSHMTYKFRVVADPTGMQFLFSDPGDIDEAIEAYERGDQVASAKDLLLMYDTFLEEVQSKSSAPKSPAVTVTTPHGESRELLRTTIKTVPGKEWVTRDIPTAAILSLRGYELLKIDIGESTAQFWFAYDDDLKRIIAQFNKADLLVEPHAFSSAQFEMREKLRAERGY